MHAWPPKAQVVAAKAKAKAEAKVVVVPVRPPSPASSYVAGSLSTESDANSPAQEGKAKAKVKAEDKVVAVPVRPPWLASSNGTGRLSVEEAVAAATEVAADAVAAADAAAHQLLEDEAAAPQGKGKAKEWVRLTRRLLSLPSHGREVISDHIKAILDAQHQRETEA